jgi:hypothetical protein
MDEKEESCCTIDYQHHKAIFEERRQAFFERSGKGGDDAPGEDPLNQRSLQGSPSPGWLHDRLRRAGGERRVGQRPGTTTILGCFGRALTVESIDAVCVISRGSDRQSRA